jgi:hypothetical protein
MIGDRVWTRASGCGNGSCVEVRFDGDTRTVSLRDSKHPDQPPLVFTLAEWAAFVKGATAGEFDAPRWPESAHTKPAGPGFCDVAGPDGLRCQRAPSHGPLVGDENPHAARTEAWELVTW